MLAKLNFPREVLLLAGFGQMLFNLLIQLVLLAILLLVLLRAPAVDGTALRGGSFDAYHAGTWDRALDHAARTALHRHTQGHPGVRSVRHALDAGPIRTADSRDGSRCSIDLNPVAPLLVVTRDWLLIGHTDFLAAFLVYSFLGVVATLLGLILVRIAMPFLIERMGS